MSQTPPEKKGVFATLIDVSGLSVGVATFFIGLFVAYDVIARSLFRMTNSWVTEVTMYLMAYITFVGAAYALKEGSHVKVDMFVLSLKSSVRRWVKIVSNLLFVCVVALLSWLSFFFFWEAWVNKEVSDTLLAVQLWIPYFFFFIGMIWLLLVLLVSIWTKYLYSNNSKDSE